MASDKFKSEVFIGGGEAILSFRANYVEGDLGPNSYYFSKRQTVTVHMTAHAAKGLYNRLQKQLKENGQL